MTDRVLVYSECSWGGMQRFGLLLLIAGLTGCSSESSGNQQNASGEASTNLASASVAVSETKVRSGPFGLAMGQSIAELKLADASDQDPTRARPLASVPRPMPELETYAVVAYPETGICESRAVSKTFDSDAYGVNVKSAIDKLADSINAKYGSGKKDSYCSSMGSCQFFQMGLKDGSQGYSYTWSRSTGAKLPKDIAEISLTAMPGDYNDTFYRLDYTGTNRDSCRNAERKAKAAAL